MLVDSLRTWLASLHPALLYWAGASLLACALATNAAWQLRTRLRLHPDLRQAPVEAARFLFYLGVPYLALGGRPRPALSALLSLDDLGLVGMGPPWPATRWLGAFGTGLEVGLVAFLLLALAWGSARRGEGRLRFPPRPVGALVLEGLYLQVHWAFYRAAWASALGDLYPAVFAGLGLVYLEWTLDPAWRQGWHDPAQAADRWLRTALSLVTALIFWLTRSLWVCLAVHWALDLAFWRLGRAGGRIHRTLRDSQVS